MCLLPGIWSYREHLHLSNLSGLVVTSEDSDSLLKADLEGDEQSDGLDGVVSTIDVVTHEEVVSLRGMSTNLEKLAQVMELTVDISTDGDWSAHFLHVRLINQNFFSLNLRWQSKHLVSKKMEATALIVDGQYTDATSFQNWFRLSAP